MLRSIQYVANDCNKKTSRAVVDKRGFFSGSGRRIRTLTYGVRVRCATFTQSRYVLTNKNYYNGFSLFVKIYFHAFTEKTAPPVPMGQAA